MNIVKGYSYSPKHGMYSLLQRTLAHILHRISTNQIDLRRVPLGYFL